MATKPVPFGKKRKVNESNSKSVPAQFYSDINPPKAPIFRPLPDPELGEQKSQHLQQQPQQQQKGGMGLLGKPSSSRQVKSQSTTLVPPIELPINSPQSLSYVEQSLMSLKGSWGASLITQKGISLTEPKSFIQTMSAPSGSFNRGYQQDSSSILKSSPKAEVGSLTFLTLLNENITGKSVKNSSGSSSSSSSKNEVMSSSDQLSSKPSSLGHSSVTQDDNPLMDDEEDLPFPMDDE